MFVGSRAEDTNLIGMTQYKVTVNVSPLPGVLDPAAAAVMRALPALGFEGVQDVQIGKQIIFNLEAESSDAAQKETEQMCDQLLANPVIEIYSINIEETVNA